MKKVIIGSIFFIILILIALFIPKDTTRDLLQQLTKTQERTALVLQLPPQSRCLLVSNIQGESNSLNRILQQWRHMGMLKDYTIKDPTTYLIFNGNCIGPASGNQEVLNSIATLMQRNPSQVFYIQGPHESKEWWLNKIDMPSTILRAFFNSLPLGLYIFTQEDTLPLRISYEGSEATTFDKISCRSIQEGSIKAHCTLGELCSFAQREIAYYLVGEENGIDWSTMQGLQITNTTWHIISSPTLQYKEKYRFFNDAFALLTIGNTLSECSITSYHTTFSAPDTFIEGKVFHLNGEPN